jgi:enterochelin esterase-like enzyme
MGRSLRFGWDVRKVLDLASRIEQAPNRAKEEIDAFVKSNQFPIVDGDTASFFFWDGQPVESVHLLHWVFGLESRQNFIRLGNTDAFYLPLELPLGARVEYKLEVKRGNNAQWMRDPLNPRLAFDPFGSNSVCPMPGYFEPSWTRADPRARHGSMERFVITSKTWGDERPIHVYLPAEFKPHKKYPLVIVHDGDDYRKFASMRRVLDNLIHGHEVAPLIVAFTSGSGRRNEEYGANPKQADFLVHEVLPALQARYRLLDGPENLGLIGASFGGVSSLYTAWRYPGKFGRLLLSSGSFVFTDIGRHDRGPLWDPVVRFTNEFRSNPGKVNAKIFLSCGTFESLIYYNRSLVPLLRDAGLSVRYVEAQDGHNWINWRDRLREGLAWLFPGHIWMVYD